MKLKNLFLAAMTLFAFTACTDIPDSPYDFPTTGGNGGTTEEGVYINETFASDFGVFSTAETVGDTPWIIDYKTAKATSYIDGTNKAATSWLISSPVDFTEETEAYVAFEYIIRYSESGKVAKNHQLLISADYTGDPAAATWTDLPYGAVEGADWVTFYKANVAVPAEFLGKSGVVFALRYTATTKASTWEVKNFKVAHGTADAPEEPEEAQEYTVAEALAAFTGVATPAVVKGYIVGTVNGQVYTEGCVFSGTAESKTNILIADNADETDYNNCMPVQLPSGAVRNALNLVENPGNYKKQVTLTGSLEKYFGVPGLKTVSKYEIEGVTPEEPETPEGAYISETFATSFGAFTTQETVGNYPWIIDYSTAKATSYIDTDGDGKADTDKEATSWLVSPTIDLTNETEAYIAFEYIIRYAESGKVADNHQLLICSDFSGDVATASWTNIPYGAVEGVDWNTFYKANVAVPAEFLGKSTVTFALRYTATTKAGTWEVKNFVVAHGAATGETPEEPEIPETGETIFAETFATSLGAFTTQETVSNYAWKFEEYNGKGYAKVSGYANGASQEAESWLVSPAINLSGVNAAYIAFDYVINKGDVSLAAANHKVMVTDNYTGDVASTDWIQVPFGAYNDNTWNFKSTGNIALPEAIMNKENVVIAFKYNSTAANSSTWEMNNLVVASGAGETPSTPETPEPDEPETPDTPDTPEAEAGVFDFTNPEALTPAYNRAEVPAGSTSGVGTDITDGETFTNGNLSIKFENGSATTNTRFWTKTGGDVEIRAYKGSTITVSVSEGTMSDIVFNGYKVSTMSADNGSFDKGTWSGDASSVTFSVTGTLNIQTITVK